MRKGNSSAGGILAFPAIWSVAAAGGIQLRYLTTVRNPGEIFRKVDSFSLFVSFKNVLSENFIINEFGW